MINKVGRFFLAKGVKFVWLFQLPLRQTLKCFAYGNSIYREKDLRDDGGVLQRPRGEGSHP